jgi:hypothetical protein
MTKFPPSAAAYVVNLEMVTIRTYLLAEHNCLPDRGRSSSDDERHIAEASSVESFSDRSDSQGPLVMGQVHGFAVCALDNQAGNSGSSKSEIGISLSRKEEGCEGGCNT